MRFLRYILVSLILLGSVTSEAQDEQDIYLQVGAEEGKQFLESYLAPLFSGVGYGFSAGWYNTGETHDPLGFDITISGSLAFIPKSDFTFRFNNSEYEKLQLSNESSAQLPTIFGPQNKEQRPELTILDENDETLVRVTSPPGAIDMKDVIGFDAVPIPMVQIGLGLYAGTDIKFRYLPKLDFGRASVSMFGMGLQHDLGQWFKRTKYQNVSISLLGAFNGLTTTGDLSYSDPDTKNNKGVFKINGVNFQLIGSKEYLDLITIYGGVGFARAGSRVQILGNYPIDEQYEQLTKDPIDFRYSQSSMNFTAGLTVKLLFITLGLSHTMQKYQVTTASIGISVR
ncbi:MAG: DUF6588 family protein [Cyclobacteriaceae bacterium]